MGWSSCGTDSKGRKIGYAHAGRCDHDGCKAKIDRGLGYACGDMHGSEGFSCEGYFCGDHLTHRWDPDDQHGHQYCLSCAERLDELRTMEFQEVLEDFVKPPQPTRYTIKVVDRLSGEGVDKVKVMGEVSEADGDLVGHIVKVKSRADVPEHFEYRVVDGGTAFTLGRGGYLAAVRRFVDLMEARQPTTPEQHRKAVYDLLLRWDEVSALKPDRRYMSEKEIERVTHHQALNAEMKRMARERRSVAH